MGRLLRILKHHFHCTRGSNIYISIYLYYIYLHIYIVIYIYYIYLHIYIAVTSAIKLCIMSWFYTSVAHWHLLWHHIAWLLSPGCRRLRGFNLAYKIRDRTLTIFDALLLYSIIHTFRAAGSRIRYFGEMWPCIALYKFHWHLNCISSCSLLIRQLIIVGNFNHYVNYDLSMNIFIYIYIYMYIFISWQIVKFMNLLFSVQPLLTRLPWKLINWVPICRYNCNTSIITWINRVDVLWIKILCKYTLFINCFYHI